MILLLAAALAAQSPRALTESTFERVKGSLFTVEIHSGNDGARSSLGSGYLVSKDGRLVTNYHVVGAYVDDPDRYRIRARNHAGESDAHLLAFDLVNDLAVLQIQPGTAEPLPIARSRPAPGAPVVSFGNPEGLGLSLIEGIANGFAEKGLVDRMLLSMPLNSGMSGGPILNAAGEVVGTNVSVMWLSNSLSFGVPAEKIAALLAQPPLSTDEPSLRAETARQLAAVEQATVARVLAPGAGEITVGGLASRRPADVLECWDSSETDADAGVTKASYGCNLQFTPSIEEVGEIASVELLLEHFTAKAPAVGFYSWLEQHAGEHIETEALDPGNGVFSAPRCLADRVRVGAATWKINTCASAYVSYPGYFDFDLTATTLTRPREAAFVSLHGKGLTAPSFAALFRSFLGDVRFAEAPPVIAVRVLKDGAVVRETVLAGLPATIGRDASCDLVLFDPSVSRRHAVLQQDDTGVVLQDQGSRNGILVNGALRGEVPLASVLHCQLGAVALELERLSPADTGAFSLAEVRRAELRSSIARPLWSLAVGLAGFLIGTVAEPSFWSPYQKSRGLELSGQALGFLVMLLLGAFGLLIVLKAAGRTVRMADTLAACARVVWLWPAVILLRSASYYALGASAHAFVREALLPNLAAALGVATLAAVCRPGTSRRFRLAWAVAILAVATAFEINEGLAARRAGTPALDQAVMPPVGTWTGPSVPEDAFVEAFGRESAEAARDAAGVEERQRDTPAAE